MKRTTFIMGFAILAALFLLDCKDDPNSQTINNVEKTKAEPEVSRDRMSDATEKELPVLGQGTTTKADSESESDKSQTDGNQASEGSAGKIKSTSAKVNPIEKEPTPPKKKIVAKAPAMEFVEPLHDFGEIEQGDQFDHKFEFKNTGTAPLIIESATATCGCTVPSYPFIPIEPGESGFIGVRYISVGKSGHQTPKITVTTNAKPKIYTLTLEGDVNEKPKEEESKKGEGQ